MASAGDAERKQSARPPVGRRRARFVPARPSVETKSQAGFAVPAEALKNASQKIEKNVVLQINSLGNIEDRKKYIENLLNYLNSYKNKLSKDSLNRIDKNPLRILDSKNEEDINILKNAPIISDYLNDDSKNKFKIIRQNLESLDISFTINPKLAQMWRAK